MSILDHAKHELSLIRDSDEPDEMQDEMDRCVLQIVQIFADQGHSGTTAAYALGCITKLLAFEPITPLTGADDEWNEVGEGTLQNRRCGHVFKQDGAAYDIEGIIWRDPDGGCFTSFESRVPVVFPYTPAREYRDRPSDVY